ncbi:MAG: hypothetical protein KDD44_01710, partial [Bdellovibrionales bacterium]|nr:hypothetical protein [Bdellovibrionales bacterium]
SERDLASLEIEYGKHRLHCWSPNLHLDDSGIMKTIQPIAPKDFEIMCFPDSGRYPFTVRGLTAEGTALRGEVIVQ